MLFTLPLLNFEMEAVARMKQKYIYKFWKAKKQVIL